MCLFTVKCNIIQLLQVSKIPSYFTEYCRKSYELTRLQMDIINEQLNTTCTGTASTVAAATVHVSEPTLNPFRSPIRKHNLQPTAAPAFSNAVIFHLEYR